MLGFFKKKNKEEQQDKAAQQQQQEDNSKDAKNTQVENKALNEPIEGELPAVEPKEKPKKSFFTKLKTGLGKSSNKLNEGLKDIFVRKKLDNATLEDLEDLLIMSDIGVEMADSVIQKLSESKYDKEVSYADVKEILSFEIESVLNGLDRPISVNDDNSPHVILMCGVNGTGKTTTIGKLAQQYKNDGKKVVIAACDTFRAAAVEQLEVWAKRSGCEFISGPEGADPASVAYQALEKSREVDADILFIDTAGRLENKKNLMDQLIKIISVVKKIDSSAPHDNIIVLDATTGQNANNQVKVFKEAVDISGVIVTKLDGTAKGGVVVSLAKQFALPIHAVGVGETIDDLQPFVAKEFANSLVGLEDQS